MGFGGFRRSYWKNIFSQLEKYFFPIKENDFSNLGKINRGYDHLCTKLFYEE